MTFEQFQATRVWHDDLSVIPTWQYDLPDAAPGYAYVDDQLYIDRLASGEFDLVIGNAEYVSRDLEVLERRLYQYALAEQFID